jgi:hypothetical protein
MPEKTETNSNHTSESERARSRLMGQLKMLGTFATMAASQGVIKAVRFAKPVIHGYTGCDDEQREETTGNDKELPPDRLTQREKKLLVDAGTKLSFEMIELATLAYPPTEGIEPYRAVKNDNGCYPAPHLAHMLSLNKAVQDMLGDQMAPNQSQTESVSKEMSSKRPVLLTSLNGDEYGYLTSPIEPRTIRRVALNNRNDTLTESS